MYSRLQDEARAHGVEDQHQEQNVHQRNNAAQGWIKPEVAVDFHALAFFRAMPRLVELEIVSAVGQGVPIVLAGLAQQNPGAQFWGDDSPLKNYFGDHFKPADVAESLCVLLLMLPSANRQTRETLRLFQDSGGFDEFRLAARRSRVQLRINGVQHSAAPPG